MPEQRKRFYKRWWFRTLVALAFVMAGYEVWERWQDASELEKALAEADQRFPNNWRVADVLVKFPAPTPSEEDPMRILATWEPKRVSLLYPKEIAEESNQLGRLGPSVRPEPAQLALFRNTLLKAKPYLDEMERFRTTRDVYHPLDWKENYFEILLGHTQSLRLLTAFNVLRSRIALGERKEAEAVESFLAIHHSLSWLHQEPTLISQLVRIACFSIEYDLLETMLGQAEFSPEVLERISRLIEAEAQIDPFRVGTMIEMGAMDRFLEAVIEGRIDLARPGGGESGATFEWLFFRYYGKRNRANMLREWMAVRTQIERNSTPAEMADFFRDFDARLRQRRAEKDRTYVFPALLFPAMQKVYDAKVRFAALARLAVAALAFERYRLDHDRWPERWEDLTPKYLASVPLDPWDEKPLKLKRREKGVLIYSVGPDGKDDSGTLNRENRIAPGSDLGFELFDPPHRCQPAPPKPADPDEKE
jgi:hypothetical protein